MIDRDKLPYIQNILSMHNQNVDLTMAYNLMTSLKDNHTKHILKHLSDHAQTMYTFKTVGMKLLEGYADGNLLKFYTCLFNLMYKELQIDFLTRVLTATRKCKHRESEILDSFSPNQMLSKTELLNAIENFVPLSEEDQITIFGSWFGSILIPNLHKKVNKINCIDLDDEALRIAKNYFFNNLNNIEYISGDVFKKNLSRYKKTKLIINTSCEHMPAMKDWPFWNSVNSECYFAFQSNNMIGIEGHVNCVETLEEFKNQLPETAKILHTEEIEDTRGTRYMLVGKITSD